MGGWQEEVWWEPPGEGDTPSPVRPDMNDPGLTFQLLLNPKPYSGAGDIENSAAMVLPAMPKVRGQPSSCGEALRRGRLLRLTDKWERGGGWKRTRVQARTCEVEGLDWTACRCSKAMLARLWAAESFG